jgi:CrcB protein
MVKSMAIVGMGGFLGAIARYLVSGYLQQNVTSVFPWGTFVVNITGCLLIGLVYGLSERGEVLSPEIRLFLTVGICGGFTTFSTLSNDALMLIRQQEWFRFALYTSLSLFAGLVAVYFGRLIPNITHLR